MPFVSRSVIKSDTTSHVPLAKAKEVHRARVWESSSILCVLGFWGKEHCLVWITWNLRRWRLHVKHPTYLIDLTFLAVLAELHKHFILYIQGCDPRWHHRGNFSDAEYSPAPANDGNYYSVKRPSSFGARRQPFLLWNGSVFICLGFWEMAANAWVNALHVLMQENVEKKSTLWCNLIRWPIIIHTWFSG